MNTIIRELIILACFCNGLMLASEEGMVFYKIAKWAKNKLPPVIYKPLIGCIYCMASFWGWVLHTLFQIIYKFSDFYFWETIPVIIICGVFVNGLFTHIYNKISTP